MNNAGLAIIITRSIVELMQPLIERYQLNQYNYIISGLVAVAISAALQVDVIESPSPFIDGAFSAFVVAVGAPIFHQLIKVLHYAKEYYKGQ